MYLHSPSNTPDNQTINCYRMLWSHGSHPVSDVVVSLSVASFCVSFYRLPCQLGPSNSAAVARYCHRHLHCYCYWLSHWHYCHYCHSLDSPVIVALHSLQLAAVYWYLVLKYCRWYWYCSSASDLRSLFVVWKCVEVYSECTSIDSIVIDWELSRAYSSWCFEQCFEHGSVRDSVNDIEHMWKL